MAENKYTTENGYTLSQSGKSIQDLFNLLIDIDKTQAGKILAASNIDDENAKPTLTFVDPVSGVDTAPEVYIGSGDMPEGYVLQIDPNGEANGGDVDVNIDFASILPTYVATKAEFEDTTKLYTCGADGYTYQYKEIYEYETKSLSLLGFEEASQTISFYRMGNLQFPLILRITNIKLLDSINLGNENYALEIADASGTTLYKKLSELTLIDNVYELPINEFTSAAAAAGIKVRLGLHPDTPIVDGVIPTGVAVTCECATIVDEDWQKISEHRFFPDELDLPTSGIQSVNDVYPKSGSTNVALNLTDIVAVKSDKELDYLLLDDSPYTPGLDVNTDETKYTKSYITDNGYIVNYDTFGWNEARRPAYILPSCVDYNPDTHTLYANEIKLNAGSIDHYSNYYYNNGKLFKNSLIFRIYNATLASLANRSLTEGDSEFAVRLEVSNSLIRLDYKVEDLSVSSDKFGSFVEIPTDDVTESFLFDNATITINFSDDYLDNPYLQEGQTVQDNIAIQLDVDIITAWQRLPYRFIRTDIAALPTVKVESTSSTETILPNRYYVFPEMNELTITLAPLGQVYSKLDYPVVGEYRFRFKSGEVATNLILPEGLIGNVDVKPNSIIEVTITDGFVSYKTWEV